MKRVLDRLASSVLTLVGFVLLGAGVMLGGRFEAWPAAPVVLPLALLAVNLAAALAARPRLRRGGLGVFHVALLALLLLAGWGRLTHYDGRLEIGEGVAFDPAQVMAPRHGPWHPQRLSAVHFTQGGFQVEYAARLNRGRTRSEVRLPDGTTRLVGDDTPLVLEGYRFYTTSNKGLALSLQWQDARGGEPLAGLLHLPSYPFYDYMQERDWSAPDGRALRLRLRLEREVPMGEAWTLDPRTMRATLLVSAGEATHEMQPGQSIDLGGATLRYQGLAGWMGYRIFHDPTLLPMLGVALAGVLGLAWHL
ncbi:MAG TPA: cytochrome c biogenesis protein ResB, partial [Albitalea sp.]